MDLLWDVEDGTSVLGSGYFSSKIYSRDCLTSYRTENTSLVQDCESFMKFITKISEAAVHPEQDLGI